MKDLILKRALTCFGKVKNCKMEVILNNIDYSYKIDFISHTTLYEYIMNFLNINNILLEDNILKIFNYYRDYILYFSIKDGGYCFYLNIGFGKKSNIQIIEDIYNAFGKKFLFQFFKKF